MYDLFTPDTAQSMNSALRIVWERGRRQAFNHDLLFGIFYPKKKAGLRIKKNPTIEKIKTQCKLTEWRLRTLIYRGFLENLRMSFKPERKKLEDVCFSQETCKTLLSAYTLAFEQFGHDLVQPEHLLIAIIDDSRYETQGYKIVKKMLSKTSIDFSDLREFLITSLKRQNLNNLNKLINQER
jgi:hypothetical protein